MRNPFRPHIVRLGNSRVFAIRKMTVFGWRFQSRTNPDCWWSRGCGFFGSCCTPDLIGLRHEFEARFMRVQRFEDEDYARCLLRDPDFGRCHPGQIIPFYGFPEPPMPGD